MTLAAITGGVLSWFASAEPDGLEWSIAKITGKQELTRPVDGIAPVLQGIQGKTAFLPDYRFKPSDMKPHKEKPFLTAPENKTGTSVSGIIGAAIVLGMIVLAGVGMRAFRGRNSG